MKKSQSTIPGDGPAQGPRLYHDLADWYPLLTPVGDYAEEAAFYRRLFEEHCRRPPRPLLDLGSGGGRGSDAGSGGLRYLEWRWVPESKDETYVTIAAAGFEPLAVPFDHSSNCDGGHEVFLGLRPDGAQAGERR